MGTHPGKGRIHLAVDAMGGDFAPQEIVAGAVQGSRDLDIDISLVGKPEEVQRELEKLDSAGSSINILPAGEVIGFDENPVQAVRSKPDSSINVACGMVAEGTADGALTMGHTGAGLVSAKHHFGSIQGIERPAPIVPLLGLRENLFLIDAGANTEVRPKHLLQFALMGSIYARLAAGVEKPLIGLLSIGSEANKGSRVSKQAYQLLEVARDIDFFGNIEGHTMLESAVNVIVCDGFVGNVLFKTIEGVIEALLYQVESILPRIPGISSAALKNHLEGIRLQHDYASIGAAALLGLRKPLFIGHGRSSAGAVINGLAIAKKTIQSNVLENIRLTMETTG
jgi:glycerol-3-phosphate acyltransferase PlsX